VKRGGGDRKGDRGGAYRKEFIKTLETSGQGGGETGEDYVDRDVPEKKGSKKERASVVEKNHIGRSRWPEPGKHRRLRGAGLSNGRKGKGTGHLSSSEKEGGRI